ncbi:MAG: flagellar hook-length control protein FliK, partial [Eubacterium sp.]|nr:flagellar hook-length control protein FliK [Eubacterium sp.]
LEPGSPQAAKVMPEDNPDLSKSDRIPETPEDLNTRSHLMETKVTVSGESVQETAFPSVTEDISEPESPQTAEVMSEPGHPQAAKVMPVPEDKPEVPDSGRIPETPEDLNIRSHLMEAKATASGETGKKETELSAAREIPEPEIKPVVQEAQDTMIAQPHLTGKFARAGQREDIRAESGDKAVLSGIVNAQRSSSSENNLAAMGEEPVKDTVLRTSRSGMADDLTAFMSKHLTGQNGSFHITLEPANLGTIHMELTYRSGEASLVIRATDPETLKLLNEHAERMGQILRENTGTETIVRVSQPDSGEKAGHPSGDTTDTEARSQNRREADENRGQSRKRENRTNAFLNMMRLGMV